MDSDILAFSKRLFQTQTANCLNPSFSVFPCCMSYYVLCIEYCLVFYTHVYVVKPMGHGSVFCMDQWVMGHRPIVWSVCMMVIAFHTSHPAVQESSMGVKF